jgi:hypothetical protein
VGSEETKDEVGDGSGLSGDAEGIRPVNYALRDHNAHAINFQLSGM